MLSARIYDAQNKDGSLKACFCQVSKEEKQDFFAKHGEFLGPDLTKALRTLVKISDTSEEREGFAASGTWLDEDDLATKYKNKPTQLASVKAKARTIWHPTREVTLYEDLDFSTDASVGEKRTIERSAEAETKDKIKKVKAEPKEPKVKKREGGHRFDRKWSGEV